MFTTKKTITILVLLAFIQSCAKGVTPTPIDSLTGNSTNEEILTAVTAELCLQADDVDTDGDGICDDEDKADDGTDCSDDPYCIQDGVGDEYSKPEKSKKWMYVLIPAAGIAAVGVARLAQGDWFWKRPSERDPNDIEDVNKAIFKVTTRKDNTVIVDASERFYKKSGEVYNLQTIILQAQHGYNLSAFGGQKIEKGDEIRVCINSKLGLDNNPISNNKLPVTYHLGAYQTAPVETFLNEVQFEAFCEQKTGAYIALKQNDGQYWINALPSKLLNEVQANTYISLDPTFNVNYVFSDVPNSTASGKIKFQRENPANATAKSSMFEVDVSTFQEPMKGFYNSCSDDNCRARTAFNQYTDSVTVTFNVNSTEASQNASGLASELDDYNSWDLIGTPSRPRE